MNDLFPIKAGFETLRGYLRSRQVAPTFKSQTFIYSQSIINNMATKKKATLVKPIKAAPRKAPLTPDQILDKKEEEMKDLIKAQILKIREARSFLNKEEARFERLAIIYGSTNVEQCYKEMDSQNGKTVAAR